MLSFSCLPFTVCCSLFTFYSLLPPFPPPLISQERLVALDITQRGMQQMDKQKDILSLRINHAISWVNKETLDKSEIKKEPKKGPPLKKYYSPIFFSFKNMVSESSWGPLNIHSDNLVWLKNAQCTLYAYETTLVGSLCKTKIDIMK